MTPRWRWWPQHYSDHHQATATNSTGPEPGYNNTVSVSVCAGLLTPRTLHWQHRVTTLAMFVISTLATHRSHSSADDRGTFTIIITSCTTVMAAPLANALQTCVNNESIISLQHCSTITLEHCCTAALEHCSTAAPRDGFPSARRTAPDLAAVERR